MILASEIIVVSVADAERLVNGFHAMMSRAGRTMEERIELHTNKETKEAIELFDKLRQIVRSTHSD